MPLRTAKAALPCAATIAALILAGCAPAPIYKTGNAVIKADPVQVAAAPDTFVRQRVIWGGKVIRVDNKSRGSEIEILAYPLDKSQRPRSGAHSTGRFVATVATYLEPLDYPPDSLVTISGRITGTRSEMVGGAQYTLPVVAASQYHRWTAAELRSPWQNIHFGLGVGIGVN